MAEMTGQWWYEKNGAQAGPVAFAVLQQLAAAGELKPSTMIWTAGMPGWVRADTVQGFTWPTAAAPAPSGEPAAPAPAPGAPPPAFGSGGASAPTPAPAASSTWGTPPGSGSSGWGQPVTPAPAGSAGEAVQTVEDIAIAPTILLSIVTFSIYGIVKFFQTGKAYERLVGRETNFTKWFWIFVGTGACAAILNAGGSKLGALLTIAAVVFQFLTLHEALRNRNDGLRRWGLNVAVTSDNTHYALMALGMLLGPVFIGLILLVVQAVKWFQDWNAIRAAALQRSFAPSSMMRA